MKKTLASIVNLSLLVLSILLSKRVAGDMGNMVKLLKNYGKLDYATDEIRNVMDYRDEFLDLKIDNIFALKRKVKIYQWVETKKILNKTGTPIYDYHKKWVDDFIDSSNFKDKTKNNFEKNAKIYTSRTIIPAKIITKKHGYEVEEAQFAKALKFKKLNVSELGKIFRGAAIKQTHEMEYQIGENFSDLDSFIAANDKKIVEENFDRFRVINSYTLFNGDNYEKPDIGDVCIEYEVSPARNLAFLGKISANRLIPFENISVLDFAPRSREYLVFREEILFIAEFFIFLLILYFMLNIMITNMRKTLKSFTLKYVPFMNEYVVYGNKNMLIMLIMTIASLLVLNILILFPIPFIVLYMEVRKDYYSI